LRIGWIRKPEISPHGAAHTRYRALMGKQSPEAEVRLLSASQKANIRRGIRAALNSSHAALAEACEKYKQMYGISYGALRLIMDYQLPDYLSGASRRRPQVPSRNRENRTPTKPETPPSAALGLTSEQAATMLASYREAFAAKNHGQAIGKCYAKFEALYGVSRTTLRKLAALDKQRYAAEYRALEELHAQEHKTRRRNKKKGPASANGKPPYVSPGDYYGRATYCPVCRRDFKTNFIPPHGPGPHGCRGSGKFGVTLYTIYLNRRYEKQPARGGGSTSVRTVRGGLPGLGKRR
jgi:hypothetical protein